MQKVILARQSFKDTAKVMIPIPEAAIPVDYYHDVYDGQVQPSRDYIRVPGMVLWRDTSALHYVCTVGLEDNEEVPDYDLDSEDDEWLSVQSKERVSWTHLASP